MPDNKKVLEITPEMVVATGATNVELGLHLLRQVRETLWLPSYDT